MKKILGLACITMAIASAFLTSGCKDEFHIPETDYIDSLVPLIRVLSPTRDTVIIGQSNVPIIIELSDDYELKILNISIAPANTSLQSYTKTVDLTGKKQYTFTDTYAVPTSDSMTYEVNISGADLVNNKPLPIQYFFTTK